ncbi:MAG: T9SS type A sorting domain-containing protein [Bacteroidetes bacterium]|nr:T9SS type A sorting domain-containing protein [Bacteroidota bacterium]
MSVNDLQLLNGKPVTAFPNPATESTLIKFYTVEQKNVISLVNSLGEVVVSTEVKTYGEQELNFNLELSRYASGIYFVKIESGSNIAHIKLVKE